MLKISIIGQRELVQRLNSMPASVHRSVLRKVTALTFRLETLVKRKLSGPVLKTRSGKLRDSVFRRVTNTSSSIRGEVLAGKNVPYAAIHEYGGTVPAMTIYPRRAQALSFMMNGKRVFAKYVNRPQIRIPQRSYMRSSLAEMGPIIREELREAVKQGTKKKQ